MCISCWQKPPNQRDSFVWSTHNRCFINNKIPSGIHIVMKNYKIKCCQMKTRDRLEWNLKCKRDINLVNVNLIYHVILCAFRWLVCSDHGCVTRRTSKHNMVYTRGLHLWTEILSWGCKMYENEWIKNFVECWTFVAMQRSCHCYALHRITW